MANILYSDINKHYGLNERDSIVHNVDAINESIQNILNIRPGEVMFNRGFGSRLEEVLFEPISNITTVILKNIIFEYIQKYETRVRIIPSRTRVIPVIEDRRYDISIAYSIVTSGEFGEYRQSLEVRN